MAEERSHRLASQRDLRCFYRIVEHDSPRDFFIPAERLSRRTEWSGWPERIVREEGFIGVRDPGGRMHIGKPGRL